EKSVSASETDPQLAAKRCYEQRRRHALGKLKEGKATSECSIGEVVMQASVLLASCKVYTPRKLAEAMGAAVAGVAKCRWLEPGRGQGAFLRAMNSLGISRSGIHGIELELDVSESDTHGTVLRGVDFLSWASNQECRFDCIVGNPPYVAIREL